MIEVSRKGVRAGGKKVLKVERTRNGFVLVLEGGEKVKVSNEIAQKIRRKLKWQR